MHRRHAKHANAHADLREPASSAFNAFTLFCTGLRITSSSAETAAQSGVHPHAQTTPTKSRRKLQPNQGSKPTNTAALNRPADERANKHTRASAARCRQRACGVRPAAVGPRLAFGLGGSEHRGFVRVLGVRAWRSRASRVVFGPGRSQPRTMEASVAQHRDMRCCFAVA